MLTKKTLATLSKAPPLSFSPTAHSRASIVNSLVPATLRLDKTTFKGHSFAHNAPSTAGEIVFTTSLVGYPESMSDPSYHGQILCFTQPLIGNYGVPSDARDPFGLLKHFESSKIQVNGIVVNDYCHNYSHWNAIESLGNWCSRHGIPAITGVDTRELVTLLRSNGSKLGHISIGEEAINSPTPAHTDDSANWIPNVSRKDIKIYNEVGLSKIALIDCGTKENIIKSLVYRGASVTCFPHDYDLSSHLHKFDGVLLTNGPGDPISIPKTISNVSKIMALSSSMSNPIPIFGICMGHQVLGLAAGFKSYKLPFGNRGHNQPCLDLVKGGCVITSQNHGYALDDAKPPSGWLPYFRNANDGSNEGIRHERLPFKSVQFHPEAMGGPLDTMYLFDEFLSDVDVHRLNKKSSVNINDGKVVSTSESNVFQ